VEIALCFDVIGEQLGNYDDFKIPGGIKIPSEGMTVPMIIRLAIPVIKIFSPLVMSGTYEEKCRDKYSILTYVECIYDDFNCYIT
jgi:hypothetical protein